MPPLWTRRAGSPRVNQAARALLGFRSLSPTCCLSRGCDPERDPANAKAATTLASHLHLLLHRSADCGLGGPAQNNPDVWLWRMAHGEHRGDGRGSPMKAVNPTTEESI